MKTQEQIKKRLEELKKMQNNLPPYTDDFGDYESGINELLWVLDEVMTNEEKQQ